METIRLGLDGKTITCHLLNKKDETGVNHVIKELKIDTTQRNHLIEKQRSNVIDFNKYSKITMIYPTRKTEERITMTQITFIITHNKLAVITSEDSEMITKAFNELKTVNVKNSTQALSKIINSIREQSIHLFDGFEEYLNNKNKNINNGRLNPRENHKMRDLYGLFFSMILTLKGNSEVITELLEGKIKFIKPAEFGEQQDDRSLYQLELIQVLTELIKNNLDNYDARITERLNKQIYTLTILGAVLIVPTILSGYFGMNVNLPGIEFWEIVLVSAVLSLIAFLIMRKMK